MKKMYKKCDDSVKKNIHYKEDKNRKENTSNRIIDDDDTIYEIDGDCIKEKKNKK